MTYNVSTTGFAATQQLAASLAPFLKGGHILELASDLGGGKTTFVQGLATGWGFGGEVGSPTFAISRVYRLKSELEVHHYDLYRLGDAGIVGQELAEDLVDPQVITIIEWADIAHSQLPADRLKISFTVTGDDDRQISFQSGGTASEQVLSAWRSSRQTEDKT